MMIKYRSDIDGLRALAIFLVLVYHGGLSLFPSGFVGVDVFFVISGFLITSIIYQSLEGNRFSFTDFYNRRLWRLQPVFVCLLLFSLLSAFFSFLPEDLIEFSRSARKTSLFISNMYFNHTTTGYFSPDSNQLPLLHTWSLSIEWQCYLFLPVAMFGLYRFFDQKIIRIVILVSTLLFSLVSWYGSVHEPAQAYYQLSSRIFEFLVGSSIALIPLNIKKLHSFWLLLIGIIALSTILYIAHLSNILIGYPNHYAVFICLATGMLIVLGRECPANPVSKALSLKPIVFIGVLSYSLYIWHWFVFSMIRYQGIKENWIILLFAYGLSIGLAYFSWRYIEKPSKKLSTMPFVHTIVLLLVLPMIGIHLASYLFKIHSGYPQRFNEELVHVYDELNKYASSRRPLCISNSKSDNEQNCTIGAIESHKKALLIGDSFSNHYWGFMDTLGKQAGISILAQGTSSCITLPGIYLFDWWYFKNAIYQECYDKTKHYYQLIQKKQYDYVILGQVWSNYLSDSIINQLGDERSPQLTKVRIEKALDKALELIIQSGAKPVLIKTTAIMQSNSHDCFFKHIKLRQPYDSDLCTFNLVLSEQEQWFQKLFERMQDKYPELILIDPKEVQCPKNKCRADINGIPTYRDAGHITDYASYQLGALYLEKKGNPLT